MPFAEVRLVTTADGSHSLELLSTGEHYHSQFGALTESIYVFVKQGLDTFDRSKTLIRLLEVGFGTGLNTALAMAWSEANKLPMIYHGLEPFPVPVDVFQNLNYKRLMENGAVHPLLQDQYEFLLNGDTITHQKCRVELIQQTLLDFSAEAAYDLVFYDAFSPTTQADMWDEASVAKIVSLMAPGGVLVTYCIRGYIRKAFIALGCKAEKLPGPPGKREMLRITKPAYV